MAKDAAYREAERRIDDALRSGTTVLDLSGMELTELPESPTQLAQVQVLLLYNNNNLKLLPDWLGQLTRLQRLNLGNTKLTAMPEVLRHLPHLRWLNLGSNILRAYKGIEKQLDLGQKSLDSVLKGGEKAGGWLGHGGAPDLEQGEAIRAQGAVLRQLHAWLKEKDASFGGLVRVQNKRQEFLWVHPQFEKEY